MNRREFIKTSALLATSVALPVLPAISGQSLVGWDMSKGDDKSVIAVFNPTSGDTWVMDMMTELKGEVYRSMVLYHKHLGLK